MLDDEVLRDAKKACGAKTTAGAIRAGLEALIRHAAYERMRAFAGTVPDAHKHPTPRRRPPKPKRRAA